MASLLDSAYAAHRARRLEDAERAYRAVLEAWPQHADALHHLGLIRHQSGQSEEGLALIGQALALDGDNLQIHFNLVTVLLALGRSAEAAGACLRAARARGGTAGTYCAEAERLMEQGALVEAAHTARMALALEPERVEAHFRLGQIHLRRRRWDEARQAFEQVLQREPGHAEALHRQGRALAGLGDTEAALACQQQALALDSTLVPAHLALGELLQEAGRHREAAERFRNALSLDPPLTFVHFQLGNSLAASGQFAEAEAHYRRALETHGDLAMLHSNLGNTLIHLERRREAEACCRKALELDPELAEAHANLAVLAQDAWRLDAAEAGFRRALGISPANALFHGGLGNVLLRQCRPEEACAAFREGLRRAPDNAQLHSNLLFALNYRDPESRGALYEAHAEFGRRHERRAYAPVAHANDPDPERPLRVGFVASGLRQHPIATFSETLFRHHDPGQTVVTCYSDADRPDAITARIEGLVPRWRTINGAHDEEVAAQIQADGIDILVDLNGHEGKNRLPLFARKPAPVQASYMGNLNTTGLRAIDYWITDALLTPSELQPYYSEALWHLPRCLLAYTPPEEAPPVAPLPAPANGCVTFGSFNNAAKLSPHTVAVWSRLLQAVPRSRLLLRALQFADAPTRARISALFAGRGIDPERIVLRAPSASKQAYLADFALIDIGLDPFPYNGVTSTDDALWMGVPVVALAGDTSYSRVGVTLLTHLGRPEWVAATQDAYVETARGLAEHPERLTAVRGTLREEMARSPLCDGPGLARAMEDAFRAMWRRWCHGRVHTTEPGGSAP